MGKSITDEELDVLFQKLGLELARHTDDSDELISSIFGSGCEAFLEAFCAVGCLSLPDFVTGPARWTEGQKKHLFEERCPRCLRLLGKIRPEDMPVNVVRSGLVADRPLTRLVEKEAVAVGFFDNESVRATLINRVSEGHQLEIRFGYAIDTPITVCIEGGGWMAWRREIVPTWIGSESVAKIGIEDALGSFARVLFIEGVSATSRTSAILRDPGEPSLDSCTTPEEGAGPEMIDALLKGYSAQHAVQVVFGDRNVPRFPLIADRSFSDSGDAQIALHEEVGWGDIAEHPTVRWQMSALLDQVVTSSQDVKVNGRVELRVEWYGSGKLEIWLLKWNRFHPEIMLLVSWKTSSGEIRASGQLTSLDDPLELRPQVDSGIGPRPGERLECCYILSGSPNPSAVAWIAIF